jgi:putative ABC transport system substrate-binding protein
MPKERERARAEECGLREAIFKGAKPAELPVQQPVKFEFVINLKSVKAMGPDLPPSIL